MLRSSSKMLPSGELLHRDQEVLPKRCLLHKQGGLQLPGRDSLLQSGELLRAGILCWLRLLRQGCPLLWSSLVLPQSVYTHNCLSISEWGCSLSERDGNLSSPSSVSFPNPFAPHFLSEVGSLYIPSLVIILILAIIWILFSNLPTIYWITLEIQEKIHFSPLMKKSYEFFIFLGPPPNDFHIFWESNGVVGVVM